MKNITFKQKVVLITGASLVLSLIPILIIGFFNYPSADDYSFGIYTHRAWIETNSFFEVLKAAAETVKIQYYSWQGTYSAIFFMALQPAIFDTALYGFVPFLLIFSLSGALLWSGYLVLCKYLGATRSEWLTVTFSLIFLWLVFPVNATEAFFWYNGSVYYGLYYAFALCFFNMLFLLTQTKNTKKKVLLTVFSVLLAILIGGGNLVLVLITPLILCLYILKSIYDKKTVSLGIYVALFFLLVGFVINVTAPGNAVRQDKFDLSPGAIESILLSLQFGFKVFFSWMKIPIILILLFITPYAYYITRRSRLRFRYPVVFSIFSLGVFCAMFTPPIYSMGVAGPGRLQNICRYTYYCVLFANIFYYSGYLNHHKKYAPKIESLIDAINKKISNRVLFRKGCLIVTVLIFSLSIVQKRSTVRKAAHGLVSGAAFSYYSEMKDRQSLLESDREEIVFKKLTYRPELLFFSDVTTDQDHWINRYMAIYYDKISIIVEE